MYGEHDILRMLGDGVEVRMRNDWEYQRLEQYEGQQPGVILGVYRRDDESGWRVISHDYKGRVIDADGMPAPNSKALELVPAKRKYLIEVERTVVERAQVEVEAIDEDTACEEACEVAEEYRHDLTWEEYNTDYEVRRVLKELTE